jgi:hypothetical protein
VDESSDTYDTIDWLLKNTKSNGKVGLYGISYPGFFASASLPDAHPAIKAVSPQAPVTDEFIGDDCNHNGAFFLLDNFGFYNFFEGPKSENGESYAGIFNARYNDAYKFFLEMGPVKNSNGPLYYNNKGKFTAKYCRMIPIIIIGNQEISAPISIILNLLCWLLAVVRCGRSIRCASNLSKY